MRESRAQVIAHHVRLALHHGPLTERAYGQAVAELYMERTPLHARTLDFHATRDPYADERANAQLVRRMLDGTVRMPVDVEESLLLALPQPFQRAAMQELAERIGCLAAVKPSSEDAGQVVHAAELMADAAHAVRAVSVMLADGALNADDRAAAPGALQELRALMASARTLEAAITMCVLGEEPLPSPFLVKSKGRAA